MNLFIFRDKKAWKTYISDTKPAPRKLYSITSHWEFSDVSDIGEEPKPRLKYRGRTYPVLERKYSAVLIGKEIKS